MVPHLFHCNNVWIKVSLDPVLVENEDHSLSQVLFLDESNLDTMVSRQLVSLSTSSSSLNHTSCASGLVTDAGHILVSQVLAIIVSQQALFLYSCSSCSWEVACSS